MELKGTAFDVGRGVVDDCSKEQCIAATKVADVGR